MIKKLITNKYVIPKSKLGEKPVTICIRLLCDNRTKAIACGDRMLTSLDDTLAFEHDEPKIIEIFDNCLP
jgi:hypothetical protein